MSNCTLRYILTGLLYAGVAIFLLPYFTGHLSAGILFLIGGATLTVICGVLRCCLTEGDCADRFSTKPSP